MVPASSHTCMRDARDPLPDACKGLKPHKAHSVKSACLRSFEISHAQARQNVLKFSFTSSEGHEEGNGALKSVISGIEQTFGLQSVAFSDQIALIRPGLRKITARSGGPGIK